MGYLIMLPPYNYSINVEGYTVSYYTVPPVCLKRADLGQG